MHSSEFDLLERTCHIAIINGDFKALEDGIQKGISVNSVLMGSSLLGRAARLGDMRMVKLLLKKNANVTNKELLGYTSACLASSMEIFRLFKKYGAVLDSSSPLVKDKILYNVLGEKSVVESKGFTAAEAKELLLHFLEDEKELLKEKGIDSEMHSKIEDALVLFCPELDNASLSKYIQTVVQGVQEGKKPFFIKTGWSTHNIVFGVYRNFGVIINEGSEADKQRANYQFFQFDPTQFDKSCVMMLIQANMQEKEDAEKIIYKGVLNKIKANYSSVLCKTVEYFHKKNGYFKDQKRGNCTIANFKPFIFFIRSVDLEKDLVGLLNLFKERCISRNPDYPPYEIKEEISSLLEKCHDDVKIVGHALREYVHKTIKRPKESSYFSILLNKINEALFTIGFRGILTGG